MVAPVQLVVFSAFGDGLLYYLEYVLGHCWTQMLTFLLLSVSSSLHSTSLRF